MGDAGQEGSGGRQVAVQPSAAIPPMPVLPPGLQDRSVPYPLRDGLDPTIGWHFPRKADSGPEFAILKRSFGSFKVAESFPLTEDGWAQAWQSLVKQNPADVPKVLAALAAREVAPAGLSGNAHQSNEPDAPVLATDDSAPYNAKDARKMRSALQKALQRPVILPDERWFDQAKRTAIEHRHVVIGLAVLGTGIASVATAGVAAAALAITAASLPALDFPAFFDTKALDQDLTVTLEPDAVAHLLGVDVGDRAEQVLAAINRKRGNGPDGRVTLSRSDITWARETVLGRHVELVRAGVWMGGTVIAAGILLLALTLIPEDIHGLMTKAATVILIVGALIVAAAIANGSWLKERQHGT